MNFIFHIQALMPMFPRIVWVHFYGDWHHKPFTYQRGGKGHCPASLLTDRPRRLSQGNGRQWKQLSPVGPVMM